MMKLHTQTFGGNLHEAATTINRWGWAEYLIHMDSSIPQQTTAVFKMPAGKVHEIRVSDPAYVADPHHDDYAGPADPWASDYRLSTVLATVDHAIETPAKAEQPSVAKAEEKPKPARRKAADKPKDEPVQEQVAEQQVEQQASTRSETGVNMNAAETAMKSDLPDWAQ